MLSSFGQFPSLVRQCVSRTTYAHSLGLYDHALELFACALLYNSHLHETISLFCPLGSQMIGGKAGLTASENNLKIKNRELEKH